MFQWQFDLCKWPIKIIRLNFQNTDAINLLDDETLLAFYYSCKLCNFRLSNLWTFMGFHHHQYTFQNKQFNHRTNFYLFFFKLLAGDNFKQLFRAELSMARYYICKVWCRFLISFYNLSWVPTNKTPSKINNWITEYTCISSILKLHSWYHFQTDVSHRMTLRMQMNISKLSFEEYHLV